MMRLGGSAPDAGGVVFDNRPSDGGAGTVLSAIFDVLATPYRALKQQIYSFSTVGELKEWARGAVREHSVTDARCGTYKDNPNRKSMVPKGHVLLNGVPNPAHVCERGPDHALARPGVSGPCKWNAAGLPERLVPSDFYPVDGLGVRHPGRPATLGAGRRERSRRRRRGPAAFGRGAGTSRWRSRRARWIR